ncbi:MAG: hypothetical protein H0T89_10725 [Deltaproteobacteria bacterium]|nr:hypothetical protein [Deltaproteobacteria bacterium]
MIPRRRRRPSLRVAHRLPARVLPPIAGAKVRSSSGGCLEDERSTLERIINALEQACQNQTRAAELLSMPRRMFIGKLDRYGIARPCKVGTPSS